MLLPQQPGLLYPWSHCACQNRYFLSRGRHDVAGAGHSDGGGVSAGALQSGRQPQSSGHTQDGSHLIGPAAEESPPPQPIGCGVPAVLAALGLRPLTRADVPRPGGHRHPAARAGIGHAGGSGGPLPGGHSLVHQQAAGAPGLPGDCGVCG